jgi:DNA repair protein RadC
VLAIVELARRFHGHPLQRGQALRCSDDVARAYRGRLAERKQECFVALSLDCRNRVLAEHEIARGSLASVEVHPREVFRPLIGDGAAAAIFAHNHPSW